MIGLRIKTTKSYYSRIYTHSDNKQYRVKQVGDKYTLQKKRKNFGYKDIVSKKSIDLEQEKIALELEKPKYADLERQATDISELAITLLKSTDKSPIPENDFFDIHFAEAIQKDAEERQKKSSTSSYTLHDSSLEKSDIPDPKPYANRGYSHRIAALLLSEEWATTEKGDKKDVIKAIAEKYKNHENLRPEKLFGYPIEYSENESREITVSVNEKHFTSPTTHSTKTPDLDTQPDESFDSGYVTPVIPQVDFENEKALFATLKSQHSEKCRELTVPETDSVITFEVNDTSSNQYITVTATKTNDGVSFNYQRNGVSETVNFLYIDGKLTEYMDWGISINIEEENASWV